MIAHVRKVPASYRATAAASRLSFYGWGMVMAKEPVSGKSDFNKYQNFLVLPIWGRVRQDYFTNNIELARKNLLSAASSQ